MNLKLRVNWLCYTVCSWCGFGIAYAIMEPSLIILVAAVAMLLVSCSILKDSWRIGQ